MENLDSVDQVVRGTPLILETPENRNFGSSWLAALVLAAALVAAYGNTMRYPFVFDDVLDIAQNPAIRHLWPPSDLFITHSGEDAGLHSRPVVRLSFAVNYAQGGTASTLIFHLTNLGVHILAALTFFGIVRRTLRLPGLQPRFGAAAMPLALAAALLWSLHPLQTNAVTYLVQRYESMMGLFYLLAVYGVVRSAGSAHPRLWASVTVLCALLSMGCKEVGVSIPLIVLLYDRTFLAGSFRDALRRRGGMYLGLLSAWLALALLQVLTLRRAWAGAALSYTWWQYARSQPDVIVHYLRLAFWPHPLVLDYDWPLAQTWGQVLPAALVVVGLVAATAWALVRRPAWGFLGAWFFLILAPTSSVLPLADLAFVHRMYLPLAAVVMAAVVGGYLLGHRLLSGWPRLARFSGWTLVAVVVASLATRTVLRNADYRSGVSIWKETVFRRPLNARAHNNLGGALGSRGQFDEAIAHFRKALEINPEYAGARSNLGNALAGGEQFEVAIAEYRKALEIEPDDVDALNNLGIALAGRGQVEEAIAQYRKALAIEPRNAEAHYNLGNALSGRGAADEAIAHYQKALEIKPEYMKAHCNLGTALAGRGRVDEAIAHWRKALEINPDDAEVHNNLGLGLACRGQIDEAIAHYRRAAEIKPDFAAAYFNNGNALAGRGQLGEAIACYRKALKIKPDYLEAHGNLGLALAGCGQFDEAIAHYRKASEIKPDDAKAHCNLGTALAGRGQIGEAMEHFQKALDLATARNDPALADAIRAQIRSLQSGSPAGRTP